MLFLQATVDSLNTISNTMSNNNHSNFWFYIAAVELVIIGSVLFYYSRKKRKEQLTGNEKFFEDSKNNDIDMDEVLFDINNSGEARKFFKQLSKKYHPDKFLDPAMNAKAIIIYQEMTKNKLNLKNLKELEKKAKAELSKV